MPNRASRLLAAGLTALLAAGCAPARSPPAAQLGGLATPVADSRPRGGSVVEFVVGNVEFLLVHEIAHLLIAEKRIPIIGSVESAADAIATLALIREEPLDRTQEDRPLRFLLSAADAFAASWQLGTTLGADIPYWGSHALSIQRYYQIACLLFGSDPALFAHIPAVVGLPEARAEGCIAEYARANESIDWLLEQYGRRAGDPPGVPTLVRYEQPPSAISRQVVEALQSMQLLERILERLHERFTLEQPWQLVMRSCRQAEAAWQPAERELLICYELIDTLYLLGQRAPASLEGAPAGEP